MTAGRRAAFGAAVAAAWAAAFSTWWWAQHFLARPGDNDFHIYVIGARVGLRHGWSSVYDLRLQAAAWDGYSAGMGSLPLIYRAFASPPVAAWIAVPFTALPLPTAYLAWTILIVGALALTWWLLAPGPPLVRATAGLGMLWLPPVAHELQLGNAVAFDVVAVAGCVALLRVRRDWLAGVVLAGACVKPNLVLLLPVALLVLGRWRAFAAVFAAAAALACLSAWSLGPVGLGSYLALLQQEDALRWNWYLSAAQLTGPGLGALVLSAVVALGALAVMWRRRRQLEATMAAALLGSLLMTPYVHAQDFTLLLPAAWLAWPSLGERVRWLVLALLPAAVVVFSAGSLPLLAVSGVILALMAWRPMATSIEARTVPVAAAAPAR